MPDLPRWEEVGRLVLADLEEGRAWRLRFEIEVRTQLETLNRTVNRWAGIIAFLAFLGPLVFGLLTRR